nr:MAG TPA: minor tail protein [Caudoviricetes sp.]
MAGRIEGITVEIGGDVTKLNDALRSVNKQINSTQSALKDVERLLKMDPSNTVLLEQKQQLLAQAVDDTRTKLESLKTAEAQVQAQFQRGEASKEQYQALQREIIATEQKLESLEEAAKKSSVAMQKVGQAANNISEGAGKVASATAPVTAGVLGLGAAVLATVPATEEYRVAQGKLNTAYEAAGYSAETAATAYNEFYKILGDTDTATEASQLLAKLVTNEEDVTEWTKIAAGVFGTFGDSLPVEGLIEASNETAKVGTVTGVLADALNWAGISEDDFNTRLSECSTEAERNKLIMDTLSGTYSGAADSFYENNAALMDSREASAAMQDAMAELATSIAPVVTMATQLAATFLNWFNSLSNGQKVAIAAILAIVAAISPVATVIGTVSSAIAIFTGAATTGTAAATGLATVMTVLTGPVGLVIAAVAAAAAAIILLWNNCEGFRTAVTAAWEVIKQAFQAALEWIQATFAPVWDAVVQAMQTVFQAFQEALTIAWEAITEVFQVFESFLMDVFGVTWSDVFAMLQNVLSTFGGVVQTIIQTATTIFTGLINWLTSTFLTWWQSAWSNVINYLTAFKDNVVQIIDGVKTIFQGVIDFVTGVFTGDWERAWQGVQDIFRGIFEALEGIVKAPLNGVIFLLNKAIGFINTFISGINQVIGVINMLGAEIPKIPSIPEIAYLAKGGILEAGSAVVGENGPELLSLLNGKARVTPLSSAGNTGSSVPAAAGFNQTLNFYGAEMTPSQVARKTRNATRKMLAGVKA